MTSFGNDATVTPQSVYSDDPPPGGGPVTQWYREEKSDSTFFGIATGFVLRHGVSFGGGNGRRGEALESARNTEGCFEASKRKKKLICAALAPQSLK